MTKKSFLKVLLGTAASVAIHPVAAVTAPIKTVKHQYKSNWDREVENCAQRMAREIQREIDQEMVNRMIAIAKNASLQRVEIKRK